jgi:type IX secretion system PorP/SprF family membrane protein
MGRTKKIALTAVFGINFLLGLQAQDLHFSQFFNSPLTTNPANTGFIPDVDYRVGAHFRNQFSSILASPYKTLSIFADGQVMRNRFDNGWLGVGAVVLSDQAGSGGLRSNKIYGSLAYHQMLGSGSLLSAGFNLGWVNKRVDLSKFTFPDQFNGIFFDNSVATGVTLSNTSVSYFDMQVGLNYAYFTNEDLYINAGYSIHHVNRPKETFFSETQDSSRIAMRHIGFINALYKANDRWILNPNAFYTIQAKATDFMIGMNANYNLSGDGDKQLIAGLYYRNGDAIIPMLGFEIKKVRFTFSYDATTSGLRNFNDSQGAQEFNLIKQGFYNETNSSTRQVVCPRF